MAARRANNGVVESSILRRAVASDMSGTSVGARTMVRSSSAGDLGEDRLSRNKDVGSARSWLWVPPLVVCGFPVSVGSESF